jgi:hypothetical protein
MVAGVTDSYARQIVFRNTPAGYYTGDDNDEYTNINLVSDTAIPETGYENATFITGNEDLDFTNSFAGQKTPDGIKVTVEVIDHLREVGSGSADAAYDIEILFYGLGALSEDISVSTSENVFSKIIGRPYPTFRLYQEHLTRLMNWSLNFKTEPAPEGWGFAECVDADVSFDVTNTTPVRSQWTEPSKLNTKAQIAIVQRESWNVMVNTSTDKVWSSFLEKIGAESPDNSYTESSDITILKAPVFDEQNIYNTFSIEYDYDIATNTYNKSISIDKVSQELYSTDYVTGVTGRLPDSLSKLRNIYLEADAIEYILNFILLHGVNGGSTYNPNYLVTASHPVKDLFDNPAMSTIGYTGFNFWSGQEATGVVVGRKYLPNPKRVEITSIVKPTIIVGRVIELETNTDRIIELKTNIDRIVEVGA